MQLPPAIIEDLAATTRLASSDTSPGWLMTCADSLEALAKAIRTNVRSQQRAAAKAEPKPADPSHAL